MIKSWMLGAVGVGFVCAWTGCGSSESTPDQPAAGSGGQDAGSDVSADGTAGTGGAAGTGGTSGAGGAAGSADSGGSCSGTGGPTMVTVPPGYCIDSTEVTRDQYAAWIATTPNPASGQPSYCSWNTDFNADAACLAKPNACQGSSCGNQPQVCVDFCDAYAYCAAVGKRLCGKIGGGANAWADYANADLSQWFNACSSGGVHNFPYGGDPSTSPVDGYEQHTCNGADYWAAQDASSSQTTLPVGSLVNCKSTQTGYTGVYDLSGNAWEWEDSCDGTTGSSDLCRVRGGSFAYANPGDLRCGDDSTDPHADRLSVDPTLGFRCCSDP